MARENSDEIALESSFDAALAESTSHSPPRDSCCG